MANQADPNPRNSGSDAATGLGLLYFLINSHATSVTIFLRRHFGKEALAENSLMAMLMLFLMATEDPAFLVYLGMFFGMQIWRRIETFRLAWQGVIWHSRYPGYPCVAMKMPNVRDEAMAVQVVEPVICFVVGFAFCPMSELLGLYVVTAGASLMLRNGIDALVDRKRIQRMHDARFEHEWYSERMKR